MILICALWGILKFYIIKKQSCIVADMSLAVVNWHGCTVPFSGFYLHYFLWCICLVAYNSKDVVSADSTIFLVQE